MCTCVKPVGGGAVWMDRGGDSVAGRLWRGSGEVGGERVLRAVF